MVEKHFETGIEKQIVISIDPFTTQSVHLIVEISISITYICNMILGLSLDNKNNVDKTIIYCGEPIVRSFDYF